MSAHKYHDATAVHVIQLSTVCQQWDHDDTAVHDGATGQSDDADAVQSVRYVPAATNTHRPNDLTGCSYSRRREDSTSGNHGWREQRQNRSGDSCK